MLRAKGAKANPPKTYISSIVFVRLGADFHKDVRAGRFGKRFAAILLNGEAMNKVNVGIIGTGWCGGIRAETCAASPYVSELHIADIKEERLKEVAQKTKPATATTDYRKLLENKNINAII